MREILFRGKTRSDKKWIYGNLLQTDNGTYVIQNYAPFEGIGKYEVDPETVCQYTGLTDKNGKKIFEGDIVQDAEWEFEEYEPEVKGIVRFMTGTFDSGVYEYNGWVVEEKDKNIDHTPLLQYEKRDKWGNVGFEVIGNIFDNPELIGD